jgi:hypothetical protein
VQYTTHVLKQYDVRCIYSGDYITPPYTEEQFLEVSVKVLPRLKIAHVIGKAVWDRIPTPYPEEFVKQSKEITKNIINAIGTGNQLTIKSLDAVTEYSRIFNQTLESVTEFSSNSTKMWNSFHSAQQQQQFLKQ